METDIYYYCTYSCSPVGYVLGTLAYDPNQSSNYELKDDNIEPLIRKCFEQGIVQKGFGLLPNSSKYFVLAKSLDAQGTTDEDADYNMNIAFVTDDEGRYRSLLREEKKPEQDIANALKETMEIDRKSDFGFTVRPGKLHEILEKSFRSLFDEDTIEDALKTAKPCTYFGLLSSQTDLDDLCKSLGLTEPLKWVPTSKKWVYCKKKHVPHLIVTPVNWVKHRIAAAVNWLRHWIATAVNRVKHWVTTAVNWLKHLVAAIVNQIKRLITTIVNQRKPVRDRIAAVAVLLAAVWILIWLVCSIKHWLGR